MNWYKIAQQQIWELQDLPKMIVQAFQLMPHNDFGAISLINHKEEPEKDVLTKGVNHTMIFSDLNKFFNIEVSIAEYYDVEEVINTSLITAFILVNLADGAPAYSYPNEELGFEALNTNVADFNSFPYKVIKKCYEILDTYDDTYNNTYNDLEHGNI